MIRCNICGSIIPTWAFTGACNTCFLNNNHAARSFSVVEKKTSEKLVEPESCENCRYSHREEWECFYIQCRRHAPVYGKPQFPIMERRERCGEWKAK